MLNVFVLAVACQHFWKQSRGTLTNPPTVSVGMSASEAYAAIPHRRTIWDESSTKAPAEDRAYLRDMFQLLDEATEVRVTGFRDYGLGRFDSNNINGQYDQLIDYVRDMPAPSKLADFHADVVRELSDQRKFFADWRAKRNDFEFAHKIQDSPEVQDGSGAGHDAYNQLMSNYPNETGSNKDAFYDYLCALDFL